MSLGLAYTRRIGLHTADDARNKGKDVWPKVKSLLAA
jgi:hypothetical protein